MRHLDDAGDKTYWWELYHEIERTVQSEEELLRRSDEMYWQVWAHYGPVTYGIGWYDTLERLGVKGRLYMRYPERVLDKLKQEGRDAPSAG